MHIGQHNVTPPAASLSSISGSWRLTKWLKFVSLVVLVISLTSIVRVEAQTPGQIKALKKEVEDLFYHGYENYMAHAFPEDELRPISCKPLTRDRENPAHIEVNDPLGNYSLTLIDSLSTLAILASSPSSPKYNKALHLFQDGVRSLVEQYGDGTDTEAGQGLRARGFDLDSKVQVFETAIRGLGGLLSAHLFATGDLPIRGYSPVTKETVIAQKSPKSFTSNHTRVILWENGFKYDGQLLRLAYDLGNRLIPAFWSSTGIPYPRVNLRTGIPFYTNSPLNVGTESEQSGPRQSAPEITETCSAGAGSLVLEFTVLSRLTGDSRFEELAKRAFWAIWNRRSGLDLIGSGIDAETGHWIGTWTGIGAGIDSFFEYAYKSYVLLSRDAHPDYVTPMEAEDPRVLFEALPLEEDTSQAFLEAWNAAQAAIRRHLYRGPNYQHPHYVQADLITGAARGFWIDALSAFYPGLLTMAGHVEEAVETHLLQTALWDRFSALPERWSLVTGGIEGGLGWWVGRPEFIESTYYLYRATEDPWYFHVGEMVLRDIKRRCWTKCGWASIQNVLTGEQTDRMESFFLGETAKYLFLLFDPSHPLNHLDEPFVFTTEGHPLLIPRSVDNGHHQGKLWNPVPQEEATCPVSPPPLPFSISNIAARGDVYHAANLARLHLMPTRDNVESVLGEYAADHPSITLSDISSPSNYTYYPWTLPTDLVPFNATSSLIPTKPTLDISFPAITNLGQPTPPLQRVKEGILINYIGGLRLGMVRDVPILLGTGIVEAFRIQTINNLPLGKDEKVFLARDTGKESLSNTDPNFTRIRDAVMLDIVIELSGPIEPEDMQVNTTDETYFLSLRDLERQSAESDSAMRAAWNAIVSQISNLLKDHQPQPSWPFTTPLSIRSTSTSQQQAASSSSENTPRYHLAAVTPTGPGAAPLPDWPEVMSMTAAGSQSPPLSWTTVYATDDLCNHKLPAHVVKTHQVLVVKRGGCNFSAKLANIPTFTPSAHSLQLVIVVSYGSDRVSEDEDPVGGGGGGGGFDDEEHQLVRPHLDQPQRTPAGLPRHNPIPMVMVGGGKNVYDALATKTVGVGVKRRYHVETQGVRITNLIIV
ncbi:hypothetical protein PV08_02608 [Exophiala spinifera]|uniref:alpha-1,2-Mannosidase n=1 Tax=Exophiala spinifera TaxID=91928 RepID=A0A0D2BI71_9EURO|nr:uncharacterized protein PV08_02608 [Exophiala spinifera]KIW18320.1 hypothetical protein PV08_02608 [Exophiala spinifera]